MFGEISPAVSDFVYVYMPVIDMCCRSRNVPEVDFMEF